LFALSKPWCRAYLVAAMKKFLCFLPGLAIVMALSGCCANDVCICSDNPTDALTLSYSHRVKIAAGINASDVDSAIVARTTLPDPKNPTLATRSDSVVVGRKVLVPRRGITTDSIVQDIITINNASPFASAGNTIKLDAYKYHITLYKSTKVLATYLLNHIELQGRYNSTGCCTCYENLGKTFTLTTKGDTARYNVTDASDRTPRIVLLPR
jgi:hypothetical protein